MDVKPAQQALDFSIVNTKMTVEAMRDSGYKSTTHAIAELIDNAIEADASMMEIFGVSRWDELTSRMTLKELAVLDNGSGMDENTLRGSLRYGYGTRLGRKGIGRFGVGLPNSSMSQATRVDVWSWQSGVSNALHTWLSIADVEKGEREIPPPKQRPIPDVYREASQDGFADTGTLVVWSDLDRVEWKRASTTFRHTEALLGRIYRRFLAKPSERLHTDDRRREEIGLTRTITCIPVEVAGDGSIDVKEEDIVRVKPNDPLYLMSGTSCPEDFGVGPMFVEIEASPFIIPVIYKGKEYEVRVRASYARPHVRDSFDRDAEWPEAWVGKDAGHTPWGKHADHNIGVSLIRSHREIEVDRSWVNGYDPKERWWTVEVDFPTALDEIFGLTNNKQGTMTFQRLAQYDWRREALPGEDTPGDVRRRMEEDGDGRVYLLELHKQIRNAISIMRSRVGESGHRRGPRHRLDEDQKADAKADAAVKRRIMEGHLGKSDTSETTATEEERAKAQIRSLVERHHFDESDAVQRVIERMNSGRRVQCIQSLQQTPAFFDVEPLPGVIQVAFNINHPVHSHLYHLMRPEINELSDEELRARLAKVAAGFHILIYSWARFEDEQTEFDRRRVRNARIEWGKYAEEFFDEDDDSIPPSDLV